MPGSDLDESQVGFQLITLGEITKHMNCLMQVRLYVGVAIGSRAEASLRGAACQGYLRRFFSAPARPIGFVEFEINPEKWVGLLCVAERIPVGHNAEGLFSKSNPQPPRSDRVAGFVVGRGFQALAGSHSSFSIFPVCGCHDRRVPLYNSSIARALGGVHSPGGGYG